MQHLLENSYEWLSDYPLLRLQHGLQVSDYLALEVLGFLFLQKTTRVSSRLNAFVPKS